MYFCGRLCGISEAQSHDLRPTVRQAGSLTGEGSAKSNLTVVGLSKIIPRLYAHTKDRSIRLRCLSIIDDMERYNFPGLAEELQKIEH